MFCSKCGSESDDDTKFCPKCGVALNKDSVEPQSTIDNKNNDSEFQRKPEWKSEGTTLILTIVLGIFGFGGIGHIYLGNITRGIVILIVGIALLLISAFTFGVGLIALIPFAIWVVYDARKQCKYYNNYLEQNHKAPW